MSDELSQPVTELDTDAAAMETLAKRHPQAEEGAEAEEVEETEPEETEEEEAPEAEAEEEDPEIDLGDIKLKKSELKAGYMKGADYSRKTAEAAEAKREAQAVQARIQQERSHYANHLDVVLHSLQTQLIGDQNALARLAQEDPAAWVAENAKFQQRYADYQRAFHDRQALGQRQSADDLEQQREYVREQQQILSEKLPEWRDQAVAQRETREIAEYLIKQGYSEDELNTLQDHRALLITRDAAKWQAHVASLASAKAKQATKEPAKTLKPGAATQNQQSNTAYQDAFKRARKSGHEDDVMALLAAKRSK